MKMFVLLAVLLMGNGCSTPGYTKMSYFDDQNAIMAIIGEAEDQGYWGMYAVACAIRNRGNLNGVYGLNSPRVLNHEYSFQILKMATDAWAESEIGEDITHGAKNWENIKSFGKPSWANEMVETYRYKDHVFYVRQYPTTKSRQ